MIKERTIEDHLREEYFDLLPDIRRVTEHLETEIRHYVLPILHKLDKYEQVVVKSRIKGCESALDALRRRQEGGTFDREQPGLYTLTDLKDLAGVRVLVFPRNRLMEIDHLLQNQFPSWEADPVLGYHKEEPLAFKYHGYCKEASNILQGEFQIVSMLIGLYWEVEHAAIYKPTPRLKGASLSMNMQQRGQEVVNSLRAFEEEFENLLRQDQLEDERNIQ